MGDAYIPYLMAKDYSGIKDNTIDPYGFVISPDRLYSQGRKIGSIEPRAKAKKSAPDFRTFETDQPLPWACRASVKWKDLGHSYYPRNVRNVECEQSNCWYGHYACSPNQLAIEVLFHNSSSLLSLVGMPPEIDCEWREVIITASCSCGR